MKIAEKNCLNINYSSVDHEEYELGFVEANSGERVANFVPDDFWHIESNFIYFLLCLNEL